MASFSVGSFCCGMRQSAFICDNSGKRHNTKRLRLENQERSNAASATWDSLAVFLFRLVGIALLTGCAENTFQTRDPVGSQSFSSSLASEVLLEVDDASVKWGSDKVGTALRAALVNNQIFSQVHYPIYPKYKVPIKLRVVAKGDVESEKGAGFFQAFFTGLFLFLPAGVIQYQDTFIIAADVSILQNDRGVGSLHIESAVDVDHILFSSPESYASRATDLALDDLANRISVALVKHREWFSK